jgi:hypothetical protein
MPAIDQERTIKRERSFYEEAAGTASFFEFNRLRSSEETTVQFFSCFTDGGCRITNSSLAVT